MEVDAVIDSGSESEFYFLYGLFSAQLLHLKVSAVQVRTREEPNREELKNIVKLNVSVRTRMRRRTTKMSPQGKKDKERNPNPEIVMKTRRKTNEL